MFFTLMISWWYGRGWSWVVDRVVVWLEEINEAFSVGILLRTLFAPWKQIQSPSSFRNFLQSSVDNFISRFIGASVRTLMLLGALISFVVIGGAGLLAIIFWPLLPALVVILPVLSIIMAVF